jgi:hypothetical protein
MPQSVTQRFPCLAFEHDAGGEGTAIPHIQAALAEGRRCPLSSRVISASISAESVELWSGSFFIGDGADSKRRAARRRERADLFAFFTLHCSKNTVARDIQKNIEMRF